MMRAFATCAAALLAGSPTLAAGVFPGALLPVAGPAADLATGDLDLDGHLDLVAVSDAADLVSVFFADGAGGFLPPVSLPAGSRPYRVAVADLDGSGTPDVLVAHYLGAELRAYLGDGAGAFAPPVAAALPDVPTDLAVADVDGDGVPDAVVTHNSVGLPKRVVVLAGNGAGGFSLLHSVDVKTPHGVAVDDLDADGRADLVTTHGSGGEVGVHRGQAGGFGGPAYFPVGSSIPRAVVIADADGDGTRDVLTANFGSPTFGDVSLLAGDGTGALAAPILLPSVPESLALTVADLDLDGRADVVTASSTTHRAHVQYGAGGGTFANAGQLVIGHGPRATVAGDFDGDGRPDLAVACADEQALHVLHQGAPAEFPAAADVHPIEEPRHLAAADLDGDGDQDLVVHDASAASVVALLNAGSPSFLPVLGFAVLGDLVALGVAHMNGDRFTDVVVVREPPAPPSGYQPPLLEVHPGLGNGTFGPSAGPGTIALTGFPAVLALADVDGDAATDVLVGFASPPQLEVYLGDGAFGLGAGGVHPIGAGVAGIAAGDADRDGIVDLVVAGNLAMNAWFLRGTGGGAFAAAVPLPLGAPSAPAIVCCDLDLDGFDDVVAALACGAAVVMRGGPVGPSLSGVQHPAPFCKTEWVVTDLNGDGRPDVVGGGPVVALAGDGAGGLAFADAGPGWHGGGQIAVADLDGDARPDVAAADVAAGAVTVQRNLVQGGLFAPYGAGCPGAGSFVPVLALTGNAAPGGAATLRILKGLGGSTALLVVGLGKADQDLGGCPFLVGGLLPFIAPLPLGGGGPGAGALAAPVILPPALPVPLTLAVQAFVADPAAAVGHAGTNGVLIRLE